jgi:farnesyl diphosphate synthase
VTTATIVDFAAWSHAHLQRTDAVLQKVLPAPAIAPQRLHEAMRYAVLGGGKRVRPLLAYAAGEVADADIERVAIAGAAVELIHAYSLVHDDLPCMDDDDLRRGRPTCHKVYGEALALLAGDALLTVAMEGAASAGALAVVELARAAGSLGMVGGQVEDLAAEREPSQHSLARAQWIHDHKTGALITASLLVGAHAGAPETGPPPAALVLLRRFGDLLGRAFQIADDCLDLTGTAHELGKNPLADVARGKLTWPAIVGLEQSLATARQLAAEASGLAAMVVAAAANGAGHGPTLDAAVGLLQDAASYAVERRR